jgi:hypothetical protein
MNTVVVACRRNKPFPLRFSFVSLLSFQVPVDACLLHLLAFLSLYCKVFSSASFGDTIHNDISAYFKLFLKIFGVFCTFVFFICLVAFLGTFFVLITIILLQLMCCKNVIQYVSAWLSELLLDISYAWLGQ